MNPPSLLTLLLSCCALSLAAVGGANSIVPELHRHVVELNHWMSGSEFAALYAIASTSPGPNVLVVTLIGWQLAGYPGALVATLGICGPSSLLAYGLSRVWDRFAHSPWRTAILRTLMPLTIGLILGSGTLLTRAAAQDWRGVALAGLAAAVYWRGRFNPLWVLGGGAVVGLLGGF